MKKRVIMLCIVLTCLLLLSVQTLAETNYPWNEYGMKEEVDSINSYTLQSVSSNWTTLPTKPNVHLTKSWIVKFSEIVTTDKVDGMVIQMGDEYIPVKIDISGDSDEATVTPVNPYKLNQRYTVKVFLNNGKKYKKDFITENYGDKDSGGNYKYASQIIAGKPIEGSLSKIDGTVETDWYRFDIKEDGRVSIDAQRYDEYNINLRLYGTDSIGKLVLLGGDYHKSTSSYETPIPSRTYTMDLEPGTYYIELDSQYKSSKQKDSGDYRLSLDYTKSKVANDGYGNHSKETAIEIGLNSSKTGHIYYMNQQGNRNNNDYYKFVVKEDGKVTINAKRYDEYNMNLRLYGTDSIGKLVLLGGDYHKSTSSYEVPIPSRTYTMDLEPGTYYIGLDSEYNSSKYKHSGDYNLELKYTKSKVANDGYGNNGKETAIELGLNSSKTGHIYYMNQQGNRNNNDYYKFVIEKDGRVTIDAKRYDEHNINLRLYGTDNIGRLVLLGGDYHKGTSSYENPISLRSYTIDLEPGTYYIELDTEYNSSKYKYSGDYNLELAYTQSTVDNDGYGNDSKDTAIEMALNSSKTGHIYYMNQQGNRNTDDYYKFTVTAFGQVIIKAKRYDLHNINLRLYRTDNIGKLVLLGGNYHKGTNSYETPVFSRIHTIDLGPGTYYIQIDSEYNSSKYKYSGDYNLELEYTSK